MYRVRAQMVRDEAEQADISSSLGLEFRDQSEALRFFSDVH